MAEKNNVAMFKQINGEKVQIGWASPVDDASGGRTLERLAAYEEETLTDISFEDDELSQLSAEEHEGHGTEGIVVDHNTVIEPPASDELTDIEKEAHEAAGVEVVLPAAPEDAGRDTDEDAEPETVASDAPEETLEDDTTDKEN